MSTISENARITGISGVGPAVKPVSVVHLYREPIVAGVNLVAGAVGGVFSVLLCQPLDTIKVKMQIYPELYTNLVNCGIKTWRRQGISGLYAGTVPSLAASVMDNAYGFMFYGFCQNLLKAVANKPRTEDLSTFQNACAGGTAAVFASFFICPTELIKCQLQVLDDNRLLKATAVSSQRGIEPKIGSTQLVAAILKKEGVFGLFRGLSSTLYREVPGYFFFFGGYDTAQKALLETGQPKSELSSLQTVFCGGFAGICCWTAIFPADVVKSRIQARQSTLGFWKCLVLIARTEGVWALYNGLLPTLIRAFPTCGAICLGYELTKSSLEGIIFL